MFHLALLSWLAPAPLPQNVVPEGRMLPITAPVQRVEGRLDAAGVFRRSPREGIGLGGREIVYDNTCASGFYMALDPAGEGGTGSAFAEAAGDYGAIPAATFPGDALCAPGCADTYDISEFEIAWCTLRTVPGEVEIYFWNTPQEACVLGFEPGNNPFGGTNPPTTPEVFTTRLTGLPRSTKEGTLSCYTLAIEVDEPFTLSGSVSFAPGVIEGDKFAWSFAMPTSTGTDGPIISGDIAISTVCPPCSGTIFEVGGQTTVQGTGGGQDVHFFWEDFGGTSVPQGSADCYMFGTGPLPVGPHLRLFADEPCLVAELGEPFCDGSDGSLASCPCENPGDPDTGCDVSQETGGVRLSVVAQTTEVKNRATLRGTGFPTTGMPTSIVIRSDMLDEAAPVVFGDGLRCVAATIVRMSGTFASGGSVTHTVGHGAGPGEVYYQLWFRNTPEFFCTPDAFNLSSGRALSW